MIGSLRNKLTQSFNRYRTDAEYRELIRTSFISLLVRMIGVGTGFLVTLVTSRYFSANALGIVSICVAILSLAGVAGKLGLHGAGDIIDLRRSLLQCRLDGHKYFSQRIPWFLFAHQCLAHFTLGFSLVPLGEYPGIEKYYNVYLLSNKCSFHHRFNFIDHCIFFRTCRPRSSG